MFRFEYMSQTELGELFGVTSHVIGKWLAAIGLRENKTPSTAAIEAKMVTLVPARNEHYNWVWHSDRTVAALEKAGHRRIYNPPLHLVAPVKLNGPFTKRGNNQNGYDIVNGDGFVAIVVSGQNTAELLVKLLNLAGEKGVIARHMGDCSCRSI